MTQLTCYLEEQSFIPAPTEASCLQLYFQGHLQPLVSAGPCAHVNISTQRPTSIHIIKHLKQYNKNKMEENTLFIIFLVQIWKEFSSENTEYRQISFPKMSGKKLASEILCGFFIWIFLALSVITIFLFYIFDYLIKS